MSELIDGKIELRRVMSSNKVVQAFGLLCLKMGAAHRK